MTEANPPLDAIRWARLKDHVADLSAIDGSDRADALAALPLNATDRAWVERLIAPLVAGETRLLEPHPAATPAIADVGALRWRAGDTIGRYRVEGLLGRGGMGEVYEARAIDDGRVVALKVLRYGLAQSDYARFSENEQRALRRLDDLRIARFIEAFVAPGAGTCLVLEWVDGEPLQTYCRGRRFGVEARLKLFIEVCHAVASAHRQLVVHRDLKPSNVLVTPDGQVKLLDFGVSKLLDDVATQTQTHGYLFTLDYAAPEQVLHEPVSTATDIYALGVLLYRLLTEVSPYARHEGNSLANAVLHEPPQALAAAIERARAAGESPPAAQVDRDLDRVVAHAMDKDPRQRYRGAVELAADVQAVLDGRPIDGGGGALYRAAKFVKRHRATVAAASVATLALIAATAVSIDAAQRAELQAHRAEVANGFLLTTLDLTDRFSGNNRGDLTLADVLERAVAQAHTSLRDEPAVRANVLVQLSLVLQHRGQLPAALTAASEAHDIETAEGSDPADRAAAAQQLASIEIESGKLDDAARHLDETLQQLARTSGQERTRVAAYTSLGKLASMRGDPEASLRWYRDAIPLRTALAGDNELELAMDYNNLGTGLHNLSRFREAEASFAHSIELLRARLGADHPRLGFVLYSRAVTLILLGRFDEARASLAGADAALNGAGSKNGLSPGAVNTERALALLDYYASEYPAALRRLDAALSQARTSSPVSVAGALAALGRVELASGEAKAALATLAEVDQLYIDNGRADHPQRWYARGLAGVALAAAGDEARGDAQLDDALVHAVGDGSKRGIEEIELTLYSGAAARRRGDVSLALVRHRHAERLQREIGWLGELGIARVDAELALDGLASGADASALADAPARLTRAIATLERIAPHDPRLVALRAAHGG